MRYLSYYYFSFQTVRFIKYSAKRYCIYRLLGNSCPVRYLTGITKGDSVGGLPASVRFCTFLKTKTRAGWRGKQRFGSPDFPNVNYINGTIERWSRRVCWKNDLKEIKVLNYVVFNRLLNSGKAPSKSQIEAIL